MLDMTRCLQISSTRVLKVVCATFASVSILHGQLKKREAAAAEEHQAAADRPAAAADHPVAAADHQPAAAANKLFMLDMTRCLQIGSIRVLNLALVLHAFALVFLLHGQLKKEAAAAAAAAEHQAAAAADAHPLAARRGELNLRRGGP